MAGEVISHVDFVIDADGFRRTGELLGTMDKYMERVQRRAEALSRLTIMPKIRLNDCLCEPLKQIRSKLDALTKKVWMVSLAADFSMDMAIIEEAGTTSGEKFTENFVSAFNTDEVTEKLRKAIEGMVLSPNFGTQAADAGAEAQSKDKGFGAWAKDTMLDWAKDKTKNSLDFGTSKLLDKMLGKQSTATTVIKGMLFGEKDANSATKCCCCEGGSGGIGGPGSGSSRKGKKSNQERSRPKKSQTAATPAASQSATPPSAAKPGKGKGLISFGKNILSRFQGPKGANLGFSSSSHPMGFDLASGGSTKGLAKTALKTGGKLLRPLSVISDIANISSAKPGKERNKAIGGALGGWGGAAAGAAIGSVIPVVGTVIGGAIGGLAGSFAGEWIGKNVGGVAKKASKWLGGILGGKKKEKIDPTPMPPASAIPTPSALPANPGQSTVGLQQPNSIAIQVSLPVGAVQLKVEDKLNYDEISAIIGSKIAVSIQQAMENRA